MAARARVSLTPSSIMEARAAELEIDLPAGAFIDLAYTVTRPPL